MLERLKMLVKKVMQMYFRKDIPAFANDIKVSDRMAQAITNWARVFYREPPWLKHDVRPTHFAARLTSYMATLATNEINISAGVGARADYINDQINRFVVPQLLNGVQLAGVTGQVIIKPFVSGNNVMVEVVSADRFYPTRINTAGVIEAGFFTDYSQVNGRVVVRVECFDLQPDGLYVQQRAYYETAGALSAPIPLSDVPEWAGLEPEILIKNVDRPLFAAIKMPFSNTIDPTSKLPVSFYANAMEALEELDLIYSEFLYEIHTGKRRRIVDRQAIRPQGQEPTPQWNKDLATDLYIMLDRDDNKPFDDYTPELRVDEYQKAIDVQLRMIESQAGISPGTFGFDIKTGKVTATQIVSDDKDTYNTIKAIQENGMKSGLLDLVYVIDVYATLYKLAPSGKIEPSVSFGDGIFEDMGVEYVRRKSMADSGYLRPEKVIAWYFGITEDEAKADYMPKGGSLPMFPLED